MLLGTQAFRTTSSFADTKRRPSRRLWHTLSGTIGEPDFRQFRTGVRGESPTRVVKALSGRNSQAERWTFLTSHARVLLTLARDPTARLRDIAAACGITERTVLAIVTDLEQAAYLHRERIGRRNQYTLHLDGSFRHPAEADMPIRVLLELFTGREEGAAPPPPRKALPPQGEPKAQPRPD